jgi:hypothetical protein
VTIEATAQPREETLDGGDVKPTPDDGAVEEVQRKPKKKRRTPVRLPEDTAR